MGQGYPEWQETLDGCCILWISDYEVRRSQIRNILQQSLLFKLKDQTGDIIFVASLQDIPAIGINGMYAKE